MRRHRPPCPAPRKAIALQLFRFFVAAAHNGVAQIRTIILVVAVLGRSDGMGPPLHHFSHLFDLGGNPGLHDCLRRHGPTHGMGGVQAAGSTSKPVAAMIHLRIERKLCAVPAAQEAPVEIESGAEPRSPANSSVWSALMMDSRSCRSMPEPAGVSVNCLTVWQERPHPVPPVMAPGWKISAAASPRIIRPSALCYDDKRPNRRRRPVEILVVRPDNVPRWDARPPSNIHP